ncbi:hypothetical protein CF319_g5747 [Tilletia indica]|uniref:Uncharacterized protein n=1 Tax=Tilletia indica TaxID=43049 RepID=A0A177TU42_9BASI|nr:hypothetical protein CF319_g5747 [Tilletia indica]KAE8231453.1 hypothetical protein CF326_g3533 [Tilletia indica]KAE8241297.1 hypothetical protein A4X13_0g7477 [Tilletia indica]
MQFSIVALLSLAAVAVAVPAPAMNHPKPTTTKVATTTKAPCVTGKVVVVGYGPYKASVTFANGQFYGAGASSPFGAASAGAGLCPEPSATATASSPFGSAGAGAGLGPPGASASAGSPFATKSVSVTTKPLPTKA